MSDAEPGMSLGRGLAWPLRITSRGSLALETEAEDIDKSIWVILSTTPGERLMHPDFGCLIRLQPDGLDDGGAVGQAEKSVREALARWEPRAEVESVAISEARLEVDVVGFEAVGINIHIVYVVRATEERNEVTYRRVELGDEGVMAAQLRTDERPDLWGRILATTRRGIR